jgi:hypothetical protein
VGGWLAFGKGGCAILLLLFLVGLVFSALGQFPYMPVFGPVVLFVVGGLLSLLGYYQGKSDRNAPPPIHPPSGAWYWTCSSCARLNAPSSQECLNCSMERPEDKGGKGHTETQEGRKS